MVCVYTVKCINFKLAAVMDTAFSVLSYTGEYQLIHGCCSLMPCLFLCSFCHLILAHIWLCANGYHIYCNGVVVMELIFILLCRLSQVVNYQIFTIKIYTTDG